MSTTLLSSKLHLPPRRRKLVARQRLIGRLDSALADELALTLVSAPAGYGKTTLLSDWLADSDRAAWLSLDARDNDPVWF